MKRLCLIDQLEISDSQQIFRCPSCSTEYHLECWNENGGCATYGCDQTPLITKAPAQQDDYSLKVCPACKEKIPLSSTLCPKCHSTIKYWESNYLEEKKSVLGEFKPALFFFIFSLLGCTAPFALFIGGIWFMSHKREIMGAEPLPKILCVAGLIISSFFSFIILLFLINSGKSR